MLSNQTPPSSAYSSKNQPESHTPPPDFVRALRLKHASRGAGIDFNQNPFLIIWEATRACALACRHCRAEAQPLPAAGQLSRDEALSLVDQVAEAEPALFIITGGDPMCRPDLLEIVCAASRKGLRVCLSPSATPRLMRADFATLREAGVAGMSLSLDGPDQESHDAFRGVPGTWERSMEVVRRCRENGISLQINTTLTTGNLGRFDEFRALMDRLQPGTWSLFVLVPMGRAALGDLPDPNLLEDFFKRLADYSREAPFLIKTTDGQHYRRVLLQSDSPKESGQNGLHSPATNAGRGFVFVSHTGEICPSGFLPIAAGNIRQENLINTYREHDIFTRLRNPASLSGKCGRCRFNRVCGGSRARAYAMTGDMFAEDPLCPYQP